MTSSNHKKTALQMVLSEHSYSKPFPARRFIDDHNYCRRDRKRRKKPVLRIETTTPTVTVPPLSTAFSCVIEWSPYNCPKCPFQTKMFNSLKQHLTANHGSNLNYESKPPHVDVCYNCFNCGFETFSELVWLKHCLEPGVHIRNSRFCCNFCDFKCVGLGRLEYHKKCSHSKIDWKRGHYNCERCDYSSTNRTRTKNHYWKVHEGGDVKKQTSALGFTSRKVKIEEIFLLA